MSALAALGAAAALVLTSAPAQADPATLAVIEKAVGIDKIPADYIILADDSSSMRADGRYEQLKRSLADFLVALAPDDHLTLVMFDTGAAVVHDDKVGTEPEKIVAKLPSTADGQGTDIGAALEKAVAGLERPGASAIASVVLITDGQHQPVAGSAYPRTEGYGWQQLRERVQRLSKTSLQAYALPIGGATGTGLMGTVFDRPVSLDATSIDQMTRLLQRPKADARAAKVRAALTGDTDEGLTVEWPAGLADLGPGENRLTVKLRSGTKYVPLTATGLAVQSEDPAFQVRMDTTSVDVAPGGEASLPLIVTWSPGSRSLAFSDPVRRTGKLTLVGSVQSPWAGTLTQDLAVDLKPEIGNPASTGTGSANLGRPLLYYGAVAAVALIAALVAFILYRRPRLHGELAVGLVNALPRVVQLKGRGHHTRLAPTETGEATPVQLKLVRANGKRLKLTVPNNPSKLLTPGSAVVIATVRYAWSAGTAVAPPPMVTASMPAQPYQPAPATVVPPAPAMPAAPSPAATMPPPQVPHPPAPHQGPPARTAQPWSPQPVVQPAASTFRPPATRPPMTPPMPPPPRHAKARDDDELPVTGEPAVPID
jgi:hypothetical protein